MSKTRVLRANQHLSSCTQSIPPGPNGQIWPRRAGGGAEMHNQGSNQGHSYLCFPELRSRQRGRGTSLPPPRCASRGHADASPGPRDRRPARAMLSSPVGLAAHTCCMLAHLPCLLSARIPLSSLLAAALPRPGFKAKRPWRWVGIELAMPHIIHHQNLSMEAAQRSPQPAAQRATARYAKRERPAKDFGIDPFNSGERPTLRPEALLSKSLCLLVQRSSGCAQLSMCGSCQRC